MAHHSSQWCLRDDVIAFVSLFDTISAGGDLFYVENGQHSHVFGMADIDIEADARVLSVVKARYSYSGGNWRVKEAAEE